MARREKKYGFHLKYIPDGRLKDLLELAEKFPMKDKHKAFCKYVETYSSIVERSKNTYKHFVGTSVRILANTIGVDNSGASRILKDLIDNNFLIRDKSKFKIKEKAWD